MDLSTSPFNQLSLLQQAELFRQVAQVYLENGRTNDESIAQELRRALDAALCIGLRAGNKPFVLGSKVYLGHRCLDLTLKPQMLRLFEIFLDHGDGFLKRDELLQQIYEVDLVDCSARYLCSLRNNLVKLVSRARTLANEFLGESSEVQEWFVHDYKTRSWALYRRTGMSGADYGEMTS